MEFKPIQTEYNGYLFRSRLEARWAIFFDSLGVKYHYKIEGFEINGVRYLPDFWLPKSKRWIEIKGPEPKDSDFNKAGLLAAATNNRVIMFCQDVWHDISTYTFYSNRPRNDRLPWYVETAIMNGDIEIAISIIKTHKDSYWDPEIRKISRIISEMKTSQDDYQAMIAEGLQEDLEEIVSYKKELQGYVTHIVNEPYRVLMNYHYWVECSHCGLVAISNINEECPRCSTDYDMVLSFRRSGPKLMKAFTSARQARFGHSNQSY